MRIRWRRLGPDGVVELCRDDNRVFSLSFSFSSKYKSSNPRRKRVQIIGILICFFHHFKLHALIYMRFWFLVIKLILFRYQMLHYGFVGILTHSIYQYICLGAWGVFDGRARVLQLLLHRTPYSVCHCLTPFSFPLNNSLFPVLVVAFERLRTGPADFISVEFSFYAIELFETTTTPPLNRPTTITFPLTLNQYVCT